MAPGLFSFSPWLPGMWLLSSVVGADLLIEGSTAGVNPGAREIQTAWLHLLEPASSSVEK